MLTLETNNDAAPQAFILDSLRRENRRKCQWLREHSAPADGADEDSAHNIIAYDSGRVVGGAIGHAEYNWHTLDLLFVDDGHRRQGVGRALMAQMERHARDRGLTGIRLETWDFQARGFYERLGFTVYGQLADCPPGTITYFMKKEF